jgi:fructokinase
MIPGPIIGVGEVLWDLLPTGPRAGGAPMNFAYHCRQLGHDAVIVSRVGDDELGRALREEIRRLGLADDFIQIDPGHPTGTVQVQVDDQGQPSYTITENVAWDYLEWDTKWHDKFLALSRSASAICYGTLASRCETSARAIDMFLEKSGTSTIKICDLNLRAPYDSTERIAHAVSQADWLKLNEEEHERIQQMLREQRSRSQQSDVRSQESGVRSQESGVRSQESGILALERVMKRGLVCVTLGAAGCRVTWKGETVEVPGIPIQVVDTVGAGDAFTAGLTTQLLEGKPLEQAASFANALAAFVASGPGGTPRIDRDSC